MTYEQMTAREPQLALIENYVAMHNRNHNFSTRLWDYLWSTIENEVRALVGPAARQRPLQSPRCFILAYDHLRDIATRAN